MRSTTPSKTSGSVIGRGPSRRAGPRRSRRRACREPVTVGRDIHTVIVRSEAFARCGRRPARPSPPRSPLCDRVRWPPSPPAASRPSTTWRRSSAREPLLNALWVNDLETRTDALSTWSAERATQGPPATPGVLLDGVPVTVKENPARAGVPMPAGSAGVTAVPPTRSSPVVERIERQGGIIVGSTVMPDWGMLTGSLEPARDHALPVGRAADDRWRLLRGRCCGRAGRVLLHVGTDIGGSIRCPHVARAHHPQAEPGACPSTLLSRAGRRTDHPTAADAALLLSVISRPDARDWTSLPPADLDLDLLDHGSIQRPHASACSSTPAVAAPSTPRCTPPSRRPRRSSPAPAPRS